MQQVLHSIGLVFCLTEKLAETSLQVSLKGSHSPLPEPMLAIDSVSPQDVIRVMKLVVELHMHCIAILLSKGEVCVQVIS